MNAAEIESKFEHLEALLKGAFPCKHPAIEELEAIHTAYRQQVAINLGQNTMSAPGTLGFDLTETQKRLSQYIPELSDPHRLSKILTTCLSPFDYARKRLEFECRYDPIIDGICVIFVFKTPTGKSVKRTLRFNMTSSGMDPTPIMDGILDALNQFNQYLNYESKEVFR